MDKTLDLKLDNLATALSRLKESLDMQETDIVRDSAIKRFEFTHEVCWKTARRFLREKHGIDAASPKNVFRELRVVDLINDKETQMALKMTGDRNEIVHTYREQAAEELYKRIKDDYYLLMFEIHKRIKDAG